MATNPASRIEHNAVLCAAIVRNWPQCDDDLAMWDAFDTRTFLAGALTLAGHDQALFDELNFLQLILRAPEYYK